MKKIYLPMVAIAATLLTSTTLVAQRPKMFFNGGTSFWMTNSNWTLNGAPANRQPQDGDSIVIPPVAVGSAVIGQNNGTQTVTLNNVIVVIQANAKLQMGNGGIKFGVLALDAASAVSIEGSGANAGQITSNPTNGNGSNNQITINGAVKFQGNLNYTLNNSSNNGPGVLVGPARATQFTGTGASGFTLGTLPVVLVGFNANLTGDNKVTVQWTTQQEVSTNYFNIERSSDGLSWQTIATVKASGYSSTQKSYSIQDIAPQTGTNLYRLRMIDFDANFGFSSVVNVRLSLLGKVSIFPNPSVSTMNVSLGHAPTADWTLSLVNQLGQTVVRKIYGKEVTTVSLPVGHIPNGNYSVEIFDGFSTQSSKLLIAH